MNKYGNRRTEVDGITFASKREADRYGELKLLEKAGEIRELELQPRFALMVNANKIGTYIGDFAYCEYGKLVIEDAKGVRTQVYEIKKKLMLALHGIAIREV